jgi:hypothetical protein
MVLEAAAPFYAYLLGVYLGDGYITVASPTRSAPDWPKLFPQHGPGRKHLRMIVLHEWQRKITRAYPERLIRGLMHSDGCRFVARQPRRGRVYAYPRYAFSNRSDDIKSILCDHLDLIGVQWTRPNDQQIQIARRADVARLDEFVGAKS